MAALTLVAANLRMGTNASAAVAFALEALSPNDMLYVDAAGKLGLVDNTDTVKSKLVGVCLSSAATNDEVSYIPVTAGVHGISTSPHLDQSSAVYTVGAQYIVGTGGKLMAAGDEATGVYVTIAGVAVSTTSLMLLNIPSGFVLP